MWLLGSVAFRLKQEPEELATEAMISRVMTKLAHSTRSPEKHQNGAEGLAMQRCESRQDLVKRGLLERNSRGSGS